MSSRRSLIAAAMASPVAAIADEPRRVVQVFSGVGTGNPASPTRLAFLRRLEALGHSAGKAIAFEVHGLRTSEESFDSLAERVVALKPAVIVTATSVVASALRRQTTTIPIVTAFAGDLVGAGLAQSLARPGGNVTGVSGQGHELYGKWVELIRDLLPNARRLLGCRGPASNPSIDSHDVVFIEAAERARFAHAIVKLVGHGDIERVRGAIQEHQPDAVVLFYHPVVLDQIQSLGRLSQATRVPMIAPFRFHAEAGAMMSYGASPVALWTRVADYVDRILRGASPATLPIEQPTQFELVINMRVARAIGIDVPLQMQQRADDVIE